MNACPMCLTAEEIVDIFSIVGLRKIYGMWFSEVLIVACGAP